MTNAIQETGRLGQSIWYDNVRRGLIVSGDLARLIDSGVSGLTSNPTIFEKAIAGSADYDDALNALAEQGATIDETYEALTIDDIRMVADLLRPLYERTGGADGYASLEVSPDLAHDTEGSIEEARRLFKMLERPNAMIKIPATPAGMPAIRQLIGEGINVNVTLIFSLAAYRQVIESYLAGLEQLAQSGGDVSRIASVASFFLSRVDTVVDAQLQERIDAGAADLEPLLGRAAIANAQKAYGMFKDIFESERFAPLKEKQARAQRPLWASTSAKNPAYDELHYVEPLIGPHTVNTLPPNTITSLLEKGQPEARLTGDTSEADEVLDGVAKAGVDMDAVTDKLLADGVASFIKSFDTLKQNIADKLALLQSAVAGADGFLAGLGTNRPAVEDALDLLDADHVMGRILAKDHTVWRDDPTEIADRLGWLDAPETMAEHAEALAAFADEIRAAGFQHVVLLGMGGSSLGPEVLRRSFGSQDGYPSLIVLDSTTPAWVRSVSDAIDPARTLFIVSSKSGSTTEVHAFYRYFRGLVEAAVGAEPAGAHFIAVTDSGTPLERLAKEEGFRRVFINPADFGGRYSVLSYFGLAPAALMGLDAGELLARAARMRGTAGAPAAQNPAALLGAAMGALARGGRDKLTLLTGPGLEGYGLWVEQLLAESTGKDGEGIIPVDGEPLLEPAAYGSDRLFVYPRMQRSGQPRTRRGGERPRQGGPPRPPPAPERRLRPRRGVLPLGARRRRGGPHPEHPALRPAERAAGEGRHEAIARCLRRLGRAARPARNTVARRAARRGQVRRLRGYPGLRPPERRDRRRRRRPAPPHRGDPQDRHHRRLRPALPPLDGTVAQGRPGERYIPAIRAAPRGRHLHPRGGLQLRRTRQGPSARRLAGPP